MDGLSQPFLVACLHLSLLYLGNFPHFPGCNRDDRSRRKTRTVATLAFVLSAMPAYWAAIFFRGRSAAVVTSAAVHTRLLATRRVRLMPNLSLHTMFWMNFVRFCCAFLSRHFSTSRCFLQLFHHCATLSFACPASWHSGWSHDVPVGLFLFHQCDIFLLPALGPAPCVL